MYKQCFIFDIDGTLSDPSHRLHFIQGETKNWDAFFEACSVDESISHMVALCWHLIDAGCSVVFLSGRSDQIRAKTRNWLIQNIGNLSAPRIYMRREGDYRPDDIVKSELLDQILADGWRPTMAFEDRARVVRMFRDRGIPCAQVADGDF